MNRLKKNESPQIRSALLLTLLLCLPTPYAQQARTHNRRIPPDQLIVSFMREYVDAQYGTENNETARTTHRLLFAHQAILEKELIKELSRYPSLIEDEKSRQVMEIFIGKPKQVSHNLLNKTADLLKIQTPLFKHFLFVDFAHINNNRTRIEKRQQELKTLLNNEKALYKLYDLSKKVDKSFTSTLCYYSKEKAPYKFHEELLILQGKANQKIFGPTISKRIEKVWPNAFDYSKKNPYAAYASRWFYIEGDFLILLNYLQGFINHATRTKKIWKSAPGESIINSLGRSLRHMINDEEKNISNSEPTPYGSTVLYWFSTLIYLPNLVGKIIFLPIHILATVWNEFLGVNVLVIAGEIYGCMEEIKEIHKGFKEISNKILEILTEMHNSYRMVKKVYFFLKRNPTLQKTFQEEYDIIRHFCTSYKTRKIRKEINDIPQQIKRKKPLQTYEVWNPFFTLPSKLIAVYTRIELINSQEHHKFKLALLKVTQLLYKSIIAKAIATSSYLPLSIPTLTPKDGPKHPSLQVKEGYTPLIVKTQGKGRIVKNNIRIGGNESTHIITGPNGGGKTTKLRTIASNMCLAPLGFICARKGTYTPLGKIYFEANPEDNIKKGESLFTYEVKRAAQIYAYVKHSKTPTLILTDEPFSKTAVRESQAFFVAYSIRLADLPCPTTFVSTTHLTELPPLVKKLRRKDFGFSKVEYIEGKGVTYKIIPGSVQEPLSNYILHEIKYEPSILNLQEKILMQDPQFKWKKKLKKYKEQRMTRLFIQFFLLLAVLFLLYALFYFFRKHTIIIKKRHK